MASHVKAAGQVVNEAVSEQAEIKRIEQALREVQIATDHLALQSSDSYEQQHHHHCQTGSDSAAATQQVSPPKTALSQAVYTVLSAIFDKAPANEVAQALGKAVEVYTLETFQAADQAYVAIHGGQTLSPAGRTAVRQADEAWVLPLEIQLEACCNTLSNADGRSETRGVVIEQMAKLVALVGEVGDTMRMCLEAGSKK